MGRASSRRSGPHHLGERRREGGRVERDRVGGRLGQAQELLGRQQADGELRPAGGDDRLAPLGRDRHGRRLQGPDDVGRQAGGDHAHPVGDAVDGGLHLDGEVEVAAGQLEQVADHLHAHPGQGGERSAPGGRGPGRGAEGLEEGVTFGAKLHWRTLTGRPPLQLALSCVENRERAVGTVDWGKIGVVAGRSRYRPPPCVPSLPQR